MHEVWLPHAPRVVSRLWASHLLVTRVCRNRVQRVCAVPVGGDKPGMCACHLEHVVKKIGKCSGWSFSFSGLPHGFVHDLFKTA